MNDKKFEVGQLVRYRVEHAQRAGRITKISPGGSLTVQEHDSDTVTVFKNRKYGGPNVSLMSEHEIAVHEWQRKKPKTSLVELRNVWGTSVESLQFESNLGTESIGDLVRELGVIQSWLYKKPQDLSEIEQHENEED